MESFLKVILRATVIDTGRDETYRIETVSNRRPTMQDVARAAGVSSATVSRVLAGLKEGTSEQTAHHVRQVAESLGYVMNSVAASLRNQQSSAVGLILADIANPFFAQLTSGVERTLAEDGYSVILANSNNSVADEKRLLRVMMEKQVDAVVIASSAGDGDHIRHAIQRGMKVVLVDADFVDVDADAVVVDNGQAAKQAVAHLLALGHQEIAVITGQLDASFDRERLEGYEAAFRALGLTSPQKLVLRADSTAEGGAKAVRRCLAESKAPTAFFVTNNLMTTGAITAIMDHGLSIPDDVSVIGFDDMDWYSLFSPKITAVSQPAYDLGRVAAERLLERLKVKVGIATQRIVLETTLIERESTRPPRVEAKPPSMSELIREHTPRP